MKAVALAAAVMAYGLVVGTPSSADDLDGRRIMERVNARPRPPAAVQRMQLRMTGATGRRVTWDLVVYQTDNGTESARLFSVVGPNEVRGMSVLRTERPDEQVQWLSIQGVPEPVRATVLDPGLPFFGTEFTFGDVVERLHVDAYAFRLLGQSEWRRRPCYVVDATVLDERLGYRRVVGWIDRERWLVLKAKYRDLRERPLKTYWVDRVQDAGGFWIPYVRTMRHAVGRKRTVFEVLALEYGTPVPRDLFTPPAMRDGRGLCYPSPCAAAASLTR